MEKILAKNGESQSGENSRENGENYSSNTVGNSNSVRNTELMMECNDCLYEGWNVETSTTHLETWPDQSEVGTHIVRVGHIQDKPEGDKMLGDPGVLSLHKGSLLLLARGRRRGLLAWGRCY